MAKGYTTRKLQVFAMHAHIGGNALGDYKDLFECLANLKPEQRIMEMNETIVAMPVVDIVKDEYLYFIVYEGEKDVHPIIYDTGKAKARVQDLISGEVVATKTHGIIDFVNRQVIVEYTFRGAKAKDVAGLVETCIPPNHGKYSNLNLEFAPVAEATFSSAINKFERIKMASLKVAKSNPGWTDHSDNLSKLADDSDGQLINVEVIAGRKESLSSRKGIIQYIKEFAKNPLSSIKSAKVIGTREGESTQTTISLENYIEHSKVSVKLTDKGHVDDGDIKQKLKDYYILRLARNKNK
jgi:hypothetical protein